MFGSDDHSGIVRKGGPDVVSTGCTDLFRLRSGDPTDFVRLHIPGNFKRLKVGHGLDNLALILNLVSDPDANPKVLEAAAKFVAPFKGKVINHPKAVLASSREKVAARLTGIEGLITPRVVRFIGRANWAISVATRAEIAFPAILRHVGTHSGEIVGIVPDLKALPGLLDPNIHYYLTEFVDAKATDGFYHKYRVFFFGETAVIRHRLASDRWSVHAPDRERVLANHPHLIALERAAIQGGLSSLPERAQAALRQIGERMPLDMFGVDFTVTPDGSVILFEANASMNFFPFSDDPLFGYASLAQDLGQRALDALLQRSTG